MKIERTSFLLGMINCFVEMVAVGVKQLALSPPLLPKDYETVSEASDRIVREFSICSYLEKTLLVTDLQSAEFTRDKWSILYYKKDSILRQYLDLKTSKKILKEDNKYDVRERRRISAEFMRLLSYPQDVIDQKLEGRLSDPFMLIDC